MKVRHLHHGDGTQEAFYCSNKVLTVSFHKYEHGFYPGTGSLDEIGEAWGKGYNINVPLLSGITDDMYLSIFSKLLLSINQSFSPDVYVIQCGGDTLFNDPFQAFNLTTQGLAECIKQIIELNKFLLFLGGGGYNLPDTARLWTTLTNVALGNEKVDNDIPEHDYFPLYGPDFTLDTWPGNRKNKNTDSSINQIYDYIQQNHMETYIKAQIRS
ncbi:unnamed protein product [Didymodactylos carnosus]|uniref:histone deacetylase n=1 Tax=Didymodactylos carnosus TaxID=1234261 RepID=A0A813RYE3_9BILA|nr:unnamed protein product [Didymodactylos carnosus]CAF1198655.1 unnamed protein product [Didymodactylos carnosus]CAF3571886.1 unnamed protein product [Didymodactylos carnosus]CAF4008894.1 unnamed protein product [Didymodactylos carnosus]